MASAVLLERQPLERAVGGALWRSVCPLFSSRAFEFEALVLRAGAWLSSQAASLAIASVRVPCLQATFGPPRTHNRSSCARSRRARVIDPLDPAQPRSACPVGERHP